MSEQPAWLQNAIEAYDKSTHSDGDILSHEWLKYSLQIPAATSMQDAEKIQWLTLTRVEAFKDWLLTERKTALKAVRGKGYWIVPPSEQAQVAAEEAMTLVRRGLHKGNRMMQNARFADMDESSKRRHTDAQIRLSGIGDMMRRQKKDIFMLFQQKS